MSEAGGSQVEGPEKRESPADRPLESRNDEEEEGEAEHVILDVSGVNTGNSVVSIQPHMKHSQERRRPIPITVSRLDQRLDQVLPLTGLQLLYDVTRLRIQQSYDINYLTSGLTSENRYIVRKSDGEDSEPLFGVCETSPSWQRLVCGARRKFNLTLVDRTQQEALTLFRRLATSQPQLGVFLQRLDVHLPGGEYVGSVRQEWSVGYPNFSVRDSAGAVQYRIRANGCCTCSRIESVFYILDGRGTEVLSHISHEWDRDMVDYNLSVVLPPTPSVRSKALILAAAFLFEYTYFLPGKESSCFRSCCK